MNIRSFQSDTRVTQALDLAGFEYEILDDGSHAVIINIENSSPQPVVLGPQLHGFRQDDFRCVYTAGTNNEEPWWGAQLMRTLLRENSEHSQGSWALTTCGQLEMAIFSMCISAHATAEEIQITILVVASVASELRGRLRNQTQHN